MECENWAVYSAVVDTEFMLPWGKEVSCAGFILKLWAVLFCFCNEEGLAHLTALRSEWLNKPLTE